MNNIDLLNAIQITEVTRKPATVYKIRIMQAQVDGFPIESKIKGDSHWVLDSAPLWNWEDCDYRIRKG